MGSVVRVGVGVRVGVTDEARVGACGRHQRGVGAEHVDEYLVCECAAARLAAECAELEPRAHVACGRGDEVAH